MSITGRSQCAQQYRCS